MYCNPIEMFRDKIYLLLLKVVPVFACNLQVALIDITYCLVEGLGMGCRLDAMGLVAPNTVLFYIL
jgi:hypothetical protein